MRRRGPGRSKLPGAGPATSPELTTAPAGTVVHVAAKPQGIVYDPTTKLVAVAVHDPYRLLLLDPESLAQKASVPLPGKARHVKLAKPGGPVLVPDETSDRLFQVFLPSARAISTPVLKHPHDAVGPRTATSSWATSSPTRSPWSGTTSRSPPRRTSSDPAAWRRTATCWRPWTRRPSR